MESIYLSIAITQKAKDKIETKNQTNNFKKAINERAHKTKQTNKRTKNTQANTKQQNGSRS